MKIPVIATHVDTTSIEKAVNLANELIDKINEIKTISKEFNDIASNIEFNITVDSEQKDA